MGLLSSVERDDLTAVVSRWRSRWAMHEARETLSEPPRTFNPGYPDTELLYEDLTRGFDDADAEARSREDLHARVEALALRLERQYATALGDPRTREEFAAMVREMLRVVRGAA
jgi:hypothetical protein